MDDLRPDAVAARVAAWHNRHPLARRITPAHVQAIGFVALPFVARPGAARSDELADLPTLPLSDAALGPKGTKSALREKLRARAGAPAAQSSGGDSFFNTARGGPASKARGAAGPLATLQHWWARQSGRRRAAALVRRKAMLRAKALKPAFTERLLPGLKADVVARWALRHGRLDLGEATPGALRRVLPDQRLLGDTADTTTLYLATAAIDLGERRARVLLGDGPNAGAIGGRLYSPARMAASLAVVVLAGGLVMGPPLPELVDMARWRQSPLWQTAAAWLQRHTGGDPGVQAAGPRLAMGGVAAPEAAPASEAAPMPDAAAASAADAGAFASAAAAAVAAGAEPAPPGGPGAPTEAAPPADTAEPVVRMADALPPRTVRTRPNPALYPDDPPPGQGPGTPQTTATAPGLQLAMAPQAPAAPAAPTAIAAAAPALSPHTPPAADKATDAHGDKPLAATSKRGLPSLRPTLDDDTKAAARKAVADLRAARGDPAPGAAPGAAAHAAPPTASTQLARAGTPEPPTPAAHQPPAGQPAMLRVSTAPAAAPAPAAAAAYALSTRLLRTRAESEQVLVAWRALLAGDRRSPLNVSVMPAGDDWRVVCWPFASRQDADRARSLLQSRGLKAETIDF